MSPAKYLICIFFLAYFTRPATAQEPADQLKALEVQGEAGMAKHDWPAVQKAFGDALEASKTAGITRRRDFYYRRLGFAFYALGDLTAALDAYSRGIDTPDAGVDEESLEWNLHGAALSLQHLGRTTEALTLADREYALTQKCGVPQHQTRAMWLVGELDILRGKSAAGLQMEEQALKISRATGDGKMTAILLSNLALAL